MDSPVILDSATKFGRGLDLDRDFPGFPFDDEGFGRRADIRSHLDDLAARHPEFADHLLGPPWADVPFPGGGGGSLHRNRNRRASTDRAGNNQHQPDEDARSQTSGGSGASSHGSEPEATTANTPTTEQKPHQPKSQGLRNHTLDIGQHQHNMENPQQQRNVRSMSAPPENRNNQNDQSGGRFVSRVEILPQSQQQSTNQNQSPQSAPAQQPQQPNQREKSPAPQQQQPKPQPQSQQQGNVRHIPIFVEGRDEPIIAKNASRRAGAAPNPPPPPPPVDEPDFMPRRQQSPPHFHRPSHFSQQHFNKQPAAGWPSSFQDPFFEHTSGQWPPRHPRDSPFSRFGHPEKPRSQQTHYQQEQPQTRRQQQPQPQPPPQPHNEHQPEAPPKPRQQVQPKDPLEKVALVQKEVDALTEQVKLHKGTSRQDKDYMYLDEMLTRELIKLDDIDTEGKENVRQARKQAIKSIQESISLLESKAPLPGQQEAQAEGSADQPMESYNASDVKPAESMDTSEPPAATEEQPKAIPLPPPSSPTKPAAPLETQPQEDKTSKPEEPQEQQQAQVQPEKPSEVSNTEAVEAPATQAQPETAAAAADAAPKAAEASPQEPPKVEPKETKPSEVPMDSNAAPQQPDVEMRQASPGKEVQPPLVASESPAAVPSPTVQDEKQAEEKDEKKSEEPKLSEAKSESGTEKPKKEPPPVPAKPGKSPKKAKKTPKKQPLPAPVSETAIPMPAPGQ